MDIKLLLNLIHVTQENNSESSINLKRVTQYILLYLRKQFELNSK